MRTLGSIFFGLSGAKKRRTLLSGIALLMGLSWHLARAANESATDAGSPLGSTQMSEAALMGVLYDLKQTAEHKPGVRDTNDYDRTIAKFIMNDWDESVLNKYYRISEPFYTTQVFVPMIGDRLAPKAFGVENRIKDGFWVIHYKGQVIPPSDGRYRFAGYAHATMLVAINGRLVLNGCRFDINAVQPDFPLRSVQKSSDAQAGAPAADHCLTFGPWVELKHSKPIDIDILFGNRKASELCAFLLVQKEGETYPKDPATHFPVLPLFQVAPYYGPLPQDKWSTRCQANVMIWKCLQ